MKVLPTDTKSYIAPAQKKTNAKTFKPEKAFEEQKSTSVGYTKGGNPDVPCPVCDAESDVCYAKRVQIDIEGGVREKFFAKVNNSGELFDPWGMFSEGTQGRQNKYQGKATWNFKEINQRAFQFYITFLQTRNKAWKINAEREMINSYQPAVRGNGPSRKINFIGGKNG